MKLIIWGTGSGSSKLMRRLENYYKALDIEILAYVDNNPDMWGKVIDGKNVISPENIFHYKFNLLVIASIKYDVIKRQCIEVLHLPLDVIISANELYRKLYALIQYKKKYVNLDKLRNADPKVGKIVVYTANFGSYDDLKDPLYVDENIKYVCFTDDKEFHSTIWDVHYIDMNREIPIPLCVRYYKFFPYKLFPDYEISVWVDSKYQIVGNLHEYIEKYHREESMLCFPHFARDCIYDEAVECIRVGRGDPIMLGGQIYQYFMEGYPKNNGLYEGGCLIRWHSDTNMQNVMKKWWEEINKYSYRDQVSLPYVCWKDNFKIDISDLDIVRNCYLKEIGHKLK